MDEASPTCTSTLPPPCPPTGTQEVEAPTPMAGSKCNAREAEGPPKHKLIVENLTTSFKQDQLCRLVSLLSSRLASPSSWRDFINEHQGKLYLTPDLNNIMHFARDFLQKLCNHGMQVPMDDPPLSDKTIQCCAERPTPLPTSSMNSSEMRWWISLRLVSGSLCSLLSKCGTWDETYTCLP